ncbi:MAG TPA: chloride channel protein [Gaiellaceae bacterium]|nr:chloride channel protein [Gaiellaceae bacterium]
MPLYVRLRQLIGASYLRKWLLLGTLIGVVAGLGAVAFISALQWATHFLLGALGGYHPPTPAGEGHAAGTGTTHSWRVPVLVALGGLVSGLIVFRVAPEAEGHGTDAAIAAVHHDPAGVRARVSLVKIVASALTIGAGGSGGREGPTAQISAGFGSLLARRLRLSPADARIAVTVGIGAGIGSIFRAPLGGAVLGAEIPYRDDAETEALIPSIIAAIVGFAIFGAFEGYGPMFGFLSGYRFDHAFQLLYFAAIGIACGLVGRLYAWSFYGVSGLFSRLRLARIAKPALGGLATGLIGIALPGVLGTGYGWVQTSMGPRLLGLSLWVVLALPFAKILATSCSIGSGGSGGIFGPGMVIGGFTGAAIWRLLHGFAPVLPHQPGPFVVVGMIACFGSIAHAPLAVMLMVVEMTGSLTVLAPAMIAVGLATLIAGDATIYRSQLKSRAESAAHRLRFALPLLSLTTAREAMSPPRLVLPADRTVSDALEALSEVQVPGAPVVDGAGRFCGRVAAAQLAEAPAEDTVGQYAERREHATDAEETLDSVAERLSAGGTSWLPVLDGDRVVGIVGMSELVGGYRRALATSLRRLTRTGKTVLVEARVADGSDVAGRTIAEVPWSPGTVVIAVQRGEELLLVDGATRLEQGDLVSALTHPRTERSLRSRLSGTEGDDPDAPPEPA